MDIGDTFLLTEPGIDDHLWIVISLPGENSEAVVIVNLTSFQRLADWSCVLDKGDHPWITHKTCVSYEYARCVKESDLDKLVASGHLKPSQSATDDLLRKLHEGANMTDAMPNKCQKVLSDQGLIGF